MKKFLSFSIFIISFFISARSQNNLPDRLKIFIDCHSGCDMTFIRTEINIVDFLLDRQAADVHVLITDQNTGSGGDEYQLIFFGQNQFKNMKDTIHFINEANNTDFEERDLVVKFLKLGLAPYIAKTKMAKEIQIQMKTDNLDTVSKTNQTTITKDPWKYWVLTAGMSGSYNLDAVYHENQFNGNFSANKVTEEIKIGFNLNGGKNKSNYEYPDDNGNMLKYTFKNDFYEFSQYIVKSISDHWSLGYEVNASRSTFSNNEFRGLLRTGIEYNIFPYKMVNTKSFTISYQVNARRNIYIDTTLFDKTKETLYGHGIDAKLNVNQKWGTINFGAKYHNYLHNWKYLYLRANTELDIRITGGLSFDIYTSAELIRDQLELPKEGATPQEVLTRRRQLATGYRFSTYFGLSYRFGSKLNNFVNPRFN
jgi:hypothetical protein